jgi:ribose transport system permease protein
MTLVGVVVLRVAQIEDDRVWLAVAAALGACVLVGVVNGLAVEALSLNPFVATLAIGQVVAGVARYIRGPVPQFTRVPAVLTDRTRWNAEGISVALLVAATLVVVTALTLRSTVWGRRLVASSASKAAATFAGIRATGYRVLTYVASAVLAGLAAILLSGQLGAPDLSLGSPYLLATVVSVVLSGATLTGGRIDPIGVALGAVFITVLDHDLRVRGYSSGFAQLVQAIVLGGGLAAVYVLQHRTELAERIRRALPIARGDITPDLPVGN